MEHHKLDAYNVALEFVPRAHGIAGGFPALWLMRRHPGTQEGTMDLRWSRPSSRRARTRRRRASSQRRRTAKSRAEAVLVVMRRRAQTTTRRSPQP